jgi:hypothetical protein
MARTDQAKNPGVRYAQTDEGVELPVVDITNPAFAPDIDVSKLPGFADESLYTMEQWSAVPGFVRNLVSRKSVLMGERAADSRGYMKGMTTYLHELGPQHLEAIRTGRVDRQAAHEIASVAMRLRMRSTAELISDALLESLSARPGSRVDLLNIGGGAASDSLNALILINKAHPQLLAGRPIAVHVLDLDVAAPSFAARSLAALRADGGPLSGLDAKLYHMEYEWANAPVLRGALDRMDLGRSAVVGSSEGGLFEYGSDKEIEGNLQALLDATPDDFMMIGSTYRDVRLTRVMKEAGPSAFRLRDVSLFTELVSDVGWAVDRAIDTNPVYHIFSLKKAGKGSEPAPPRGD